MTGADPAVPRRDDGALGQETDDGPVAPFPGGAATHRPGGEGEITERRTETDGESRRG